MSSIYWWSTFQAIVSDNLKSGVTKAHRYAPVINKTFKDCGLHYNTVICTAYKPRDKALVEGAVHLVYQRIYYELSKQQFFSLGQLNEAISQLLEQYNDYNFQNKDISRRQQFMDIENNCNPCRHSHTSYAITNVEKFRR